MECQENCEYSDYLPDSKYLKCECNVSNEKKIDTKEPEKITAKSITKSLFDVLKYSNYKVIKCYKLVFRKITIKKNVGSILSNIYLIGYLIAFAIFCNSKFTYLTSEIEKLLKIESIDKNNTIEANNEDISVIQKNIIYDKEIKDKEKIDDLNKEVKNEENKEVEMIKIFNKKKESNNFIKNNKNRINIKNNDNKKNAINIIKGEKIGENKQNYKNISSPKINFYSENKNLDSKDSSIKKLAMFDQEKFLY